MLAMNKFEISVVICTCNRAAMIAQAVQSVLDQAVPDNLKYEVVVIDDGSTDQTGEVVKRMIGAGNQDKLRYVYKPGGGVADARNFGVKEASGAWIAFFDDDQIAEPQWLSALYQVVQEQHAKCVGGSLSLLLPDGFDLDLGPKSRRVLGERNFGTEVRKYDQDSDSVPGTGNVLFHKQLFEQINGFDTTMREGAEDTDFFSRMRALGHDIWYTPHAHAHHVIPESRANLDFIRWVTTKSGVAWARIQYKHRGSKQLLVTSLSRLVGSVVRDIPLATWSFLSGNYALRTDCLCTSNFTVGYIRGSLHFLSPNLFKQKKFMEFVDFRRHGGERKN